MFCCCSPSAAPSSKMAPGCQNTSSTDENNKNAPAPSAAAGTAELVGVTIPQGMKSGQNILVQHPSGNGQVKATIPPGHDSGATFYVRFPTAVPVVVAGVPVQSSAADDFAVGFGAADNTRKNHAQQPQYRPPQQQQQKQERKKYKRCSEEMMLLNKKGLVRIKVPPNLGAGDKMRVQIPDGRMITATVPPGNVSEFQVKVPPKKQNFHDNPIAVHAPMALGPLMMM